MYLSLVGRQSKTVISGHYSYDHKLSSVPCYCLSKGNLVQSGIWDRRAHGIGRIPDGDLHGRRGRLSTNP
jgi:hypothetical protein